MSPTLVTGDDGHEAKVVDQDDLLQAERYLRNWILGVMGGLIAAVIAATVMVITLQGNLAHLAESVKTLQEQGSDAVRQLQVDVAVIRTKQDASAAALEQNRIVLLDIMDLLNKRR